MTETSANVTLEEVHPSCLLSAENERLEEDEDHVVDSKVLLFAYRVVDPLDSYLLVEIVHASNLLHPSLVTLLGAVMENAPCCSQTLAPCSQAVSYQEEDLDEQVHLVLGCT